MNQISPSAANRFGDILRAVQNASAPMALLAGEQIQYSNGSFNEMYGDCLGKNIGYFFSPEYIEQLNWLIKGAHGEADKLILPLKDDVSSQYAGKSLMVQIWPIDEKFCFISLRPDYSADRLADVDELTGLPNRRKALMLLEIERSRVNRSQDFCLALCDIDHFKSVNDTHGHDVGDKVLQYVAGVMTAGLREGDWVARWGGEEFMIFTAESDLITGMQPIERIRQTLEEAAYAGPPELNITMSFGLVSSSSRHSLNTLINKADMLLYEAKHNGRNRIEWEGSGEVIWIAENIRKAAESGELTATYAPIHDLQGQVIARQIVPYLHGYSGYETDKMISAVDRLHQQILVDKALMAAVERDVSEADAASYFFPLRRQSFDMHKQEIVDFLARHPALGIAIDAAAPPPPFIIAELPGTRPLALFNYNPGVSPSYLLGLPQLSHIIFSSAKESEGVLTLVKDKVLCFLQYKGEVDERDKQLARQKGFDGWIVRTATETNRNESAAPAPRR